MDFGPRHERNAKPACCASMIMSPFVLDRNVPLIGLPEGGQIGTDRDEQERVRKSGSVSASAQQAVGGSGRGTIAACELPASEAAVEAVPGGRCCRSETPQRRASIESRAPAEVSGEGAAVGAPEVQWASRRAVRADVGDGAFSERRWAAGRCGNAAALDAGGGFVEWGAEASRTPPTARAQGTLWRVGADGRELSRLAGGSRPRRLPDRHGG